MTRRTPFVVLAGLMLALWIVAGFAAVHFITPTLAYSWPAA